MRVHACRHMLSERARLHSASSTSIKTWDSHVPCPSCARQPGCTPPHWVRKQATQGHSCVQRLLVRRCLAAGADLGHASCPQVNHANGMSPACDTWPARLLCPRSALGRTPAVQAAASQTRVLTSCTAALSTPSGAAARLQARAWGMPRVHSNSHVTGPACGFLVLADLLALWSAGTHRPTPAALPAGQPDPRAARLCGCAQRLIVSHCLAASSPGATPRAGSSGTSRTPNLNSPGGTAYSCTGFRVLRVKGSVGELKGGVRVEGVGDRV